MITKEMIDRINFLSRKSREESLNEDEKLEQQQLRKEYIEHIKGQVRQQLESIEFVEDQQQDCGHDHSGHKHGKDCGCKHN